MLLPTNSTFSYPYVVTRTVQNIFVLSADGSKLVAHRLIPCVKSFKLQVFFEKNCEKKIGLCCQSFLLFSFFIFLIALLFEVEDDHCEDSCIAAGGYTADAFATRVRIADSRH